MKKILALLSALLILLTLVACGSGDPAEASEETAETYRDASEIPETIEGAKELIQNSLGALPEAAADIVRCNCYDSAMNPACVPGRIVEQVLTVTTDGGDPTVFRVASFVDENDRFYSYQLITVGEEESFYIMDPTLYGEIPCIVSGSSDEDCFLSLYSPEMYEYATTLMYRYDFFGIDEDVTVVSDETAGDERVVTLSQSDMVEGGEPDSLVFHLNSDNLLLSYEWTFVNPNGERVVRSAEFSYPAAMDPVFTEVRDELADLDEDAEDLCSLTLVFNPGKEDEITRKTTVSRDAYLTVVASPNGSGHTLYTDEALTQPLEQYTFPDLSSGDVTLYIVFDAA